MAERRMFAKTIIDSDAFLDMPVSSQCLYFHLGMEADDEGFVNRPKSIVRMCSCTEDDLKLLIAKKFVIGFDSGIVVIKHWRINNQIKKDRFKPTNYKDEKALLSSDCNNAYSLEPNWNQIGTKLEPQYRLGKDRVVEDRVDKYRYDDDDGAEPQPVETVENLIFGKYRNVIMTETEYNDLFERFEDAEDKVQWLSYYLFEHPEKKYASHYRTIIRWDNNRRLEAVQS